MGLFDGAEAKPEKRRLSVQQMIGGGVLDEDVLKERAKPDSSSPVSVRAPLKAVPEGLLTVSRASGSPYIESLDMNAPRAMSEMSRPKAKGKVAEPPLTLSEFKAKMRLTSSETEINLLNRSLTDDDAKHLVAIINEGRVTKLMLAKNQLGDATACAIAVCLTRNNSLETLGLAANQIGDRGARALGEALAYNATLRSLFLSDNQLNDQTLAALVAANEARQCPMNGLTGLVL